MPAVTAESVQSLRAALAPYSRVLILAHNNPDPDAIASAAAMRLIVNHTDHKRATIAYAGFLTRAENREMVQRLSIPMHDISHIDLRRYRAIIVIDTQPGAKNYATAATERIIGVVDHHPLRSGTKGLPWNLVDPEVGATSTLMHELLKAADVKPPSNISTALLLGIKTDTQDLGREAAGRDLAAYKELFPVAEHRKLSLISHPRLPVGYYRTVCEAITSAHMYGDLLHVPIGAVTTPEYVSEIADYMTNLVGVRWVVATGEFNGDLYFSMRTLTARKDAGRILRRAIGRAGFAGGHRKMAGGVLTLSAMDAEKRSVAKDKVLTALFEALGANTSAPAALLESPRCGETEERPESPNE